jgi:hypothetical protein
MLEPIIPARPTFPAADEERATRQALRFQVLNEQFGPDDKYARDWIRQAVGDERAEAIGTPDISGNSLAVAAIQLSTPGLYGLGAPLLRHENPNALAAMTKLTSAYWGVMQWIQRMVCGMGDFILRVDAEDGEITLRPAFPWDVIVKTCATNPSRIEELRELRLRIGADGKPAWMWDVYKVPAIDDDGDEAGETDDVVSYSVELPNGEDVSPDHLEVQLPDGTMAPAPAGGLQGADYPYRLADGTAVLPFVFYAMEDNLGIWHDTYMRGATRGAMNSIMNWTYAGFAVHAATSAPMIGVGITPPGGNADSIGMQVSKVSVPILPGTVLLLGKQPDYDGQPLLTTGSVAPVRDILGYCEAYEGRQMLRMGVGADDITHDKANPTSAASLAISRAGKREISDRLRPFFQRADLQALRLFAMFSRMLGERLPEDGWSIEYPTLPLSLEEAEAQRERDAFDVAQGLASRLDLWLRRHPGRTREEGAADLDRIDAENRRHPMPTTQPTTTGNS